MSMNTVVIAGVVAKDPAWIDLNGKPAVRVALSWSEMRPSKTEQGAMERHHMTTWVASNRQEAMDAMAATQVGDHLVVRGHFEERKSQDGERTVTRIVIVADEAGPTMAVAFFKGRLGRDPESKGEKGNIVEVRAAADWYKAHPGGSGERVPVWMTMTSFFAKSSEFLLKHFRKGDDIVVMGTYQEDVFTREDNSKGIRSGIKMLERDFGARAKANQDQGRGGGGSSGYGGGDPFGDDPFADEDQGRASNNYGPDWRNGKSQGGGGSGSYGGVGGGDLGDDDIPF